MDTEYATNEAAGEAVAEDLEPIGAGGDWGEGGGTVSDDGETVEPLAEIEVGGRRHRVPESLKGGFLMHADYTRKTQELAEQRRTLEAERASFEAGRSHREERKALSQLEEQLGKFQGLNWEAMAAEDPNLAKEAWEAFSALNHNREALAGRLAEREAQNTETRWRAMPPNSESGHAVLSRDVPDWSPQLAGEMARYAQAEFGFTRQEMTRCWIRGLSSCAQGLRRKPAGGPGKPPSRRTGHTTGPALRGGSGAFHASADTDDFAAFERMADARLKVGWSRAAKVANVPLVFWLCWVKLQHNL